MLLSPLCLFGGVGAFQQRNQINDMNKEQINERLEYLREELRQERISYGELLELQSLAEHIDLGDVELLEAAGVPEGTKTYRVTATYISGCYIDVRATSEDEAYEKAKEIDGGEFIPDESMGLHSWELDENDMTNAKLIDNNSTT